MIWLLGGLGALGLVGGAALLALRPYAFYFIVFLIVTVIAGSTQYYARIDAAWWAATAAAAALFVRDWIENRAARTNVHFQLGSYFYLLAAFLIWALFVSVVNDVPQAQLLVAVKNYAMMWAIAPVVANLAGKKLFYSRIEFALIGLVLLQLPIVLAQQRASGGHWDAVVGTFGGDPQGGGASGTLMLYTVVGILVMLSLWQRRRVPWWLALGTFLACFLIITLAEVKAFFFLMPLAVVVQQRRLIARSPVQATALLGGFAMATYLVLGIYSSSYTKTDTRSDQLIKAIEDNFDPSYIAEGGEVSRGASIVLWTRYAGPGTIERTLGYGAGASRLGSAVSVGSLATRFGRIGLNATAMAQLLWDTGVIGLLLFLSVFIAALRCALRAGRRAVSAVARSRANTLAGIFAVAIPMLVYDRSIIDLPAVEFLFATALGLLAALERTQPVAVRRPVRSVEGRMGKRPALTAR